MTTFTWYANSGGFGALAYSYYKAQGSILNYMSGVGPHSTDLQLLSDAIGDTFILGDKIDNITAGVGSDLIYGGTDASGRVGLGDDALFGGKGDDRIEGGLGADGMYGGEGSDWLFYQRSRAGVYIDIAANVAHSEISFLSSDADGDMINGFENISGSRYGDFLIGNIYDNELNGMDGNDTLSGGLGTNYLRGASGNDVYILGSGADIIVDDAGFDTVRFTNPSQINFIANSSSGDPSNDLWNDDDIERFEGSFGSDAIILRATGGGNKEMTGGGGNDSLSGRAGNDAISGDSGMDWLRGAAGHDILRGGGDNDTLIGDAGNDTLIGGTEDDLLLGGADLDTANFSDHFGTISGGWDINLSKQVAKTVNNIFGFSYTEVDTMSEIENAIGSAGKDTFHVGYNSANRTVTANVSGGAGIDTIVLEASVGDSRVTVDDDFLHLGARSLGEESYGSSLAIAYTFSDIEIVHAGVGWDTVFGSSDGDSVYGDDGGDRIFGQGGSDKLFGGTGGDVLIGGAGHDSLYGGAGVDHFWFDTKPTTLANSDVIADYVHLTDQILLYTASFLALGAAVNSTELRIGLAALDKNDFLVYDKTAGKLYYDADGSGIGAMQLITRLTAGTVLTTNDFVMTGSPWF